MGRISEVNFVVLAKLAFGAVVTAEKLTLFTNIGFARHDLRLALPWYQLGKARTLVKEELGNAYVESHLNEWIIENRGKDIRMVVLPQPERKPDYRKAS